MTIKEMIEKGIEGGYDVQVSYAKGLPDVYAKDGYFVSLEKILLDPLFWQAVGKVEAQNTAFRNSEQTHRMWAIGMMHRMIDALAEGKTLQEYIETL